MANGPGGRIPPDNRGPQAKGVGKNSKRHDLERQATPGLHGSDLQKGDVQALEQGQRVTAKKTQGPAAPQGQGQAPAAAAPQGAMQVPDAIDFLSARQGNEFNAPQPGKTVINERALSWVPIIQGVVTGPGSSGQLAAAFVNQARAMRKANSSPSATIDMDSIDEGLEVMLDELGS